METLEAANRENPTLLAKPVLTRAKGTRPPLGAITNKVLNNATHKPSFKEKPQAVKTRKAATKGKTTLKAAAKFEEVVVAPETKEIADLAQAFSTQLLPANVEDIDNEDSTNPQLVSCYVNDIYRYLKMLEVKYGVEKSYLDGQTEITGRMRAVLVDWLIQVHLRFHLLQETLYLTVSIIDRFLQEEKVKRSKLQLIGVTAMFIASKYEEMYAPEVGDFVYITDNAYSKTEILKMEQMILRTLGFNLGKPLPLHFLRRNSKAGNVDATMHTLAKYLMEIMLPEYDLAHHTPSFMAASALYLAIKLIDNSPWTETLAHYSQYSEKELLPLVSHLCKLLLKSETAKLQAVRSKYSSSKLMKISTLPELKSPMVTKFATDCNQDS